jgi:hypothetical protein
MSVKNEWPTAKINFAVVIQNQLLFFSVGRFFGDHCIVRSSTCMLLRKFLREKTLGEM